MKTLILLLTINTATTIGIGYCHAKYGQNHWPCHGWNNCPLGGGPFIRLMLIFQLQNEAALPWHWQPESWGACKEDEVFTRSLLCRVYKSKIFFSVCLSVITSGFRIEALYIIRPRITPDPTFLLGRGWCQLSSGDVNDTHKVLQRPSVFYILYFKSRGFKDFKYDMDMDMDMDMSDMDMMDKDVVDTKTKTKT